MRSGSGQAVVTCRERSRDVDINLEVVVMPVADVAAARSEQARTELAT